MDDSIEMRDPREVMVAMMLEGRAVANMPDMRAHVLSAAERYADQIIAALDAAGYAIVPVEPTPAMRRAWQAADDEFREGYLVGEEEPIYAPDHQWRAMLAATSRRSCQHP